VAALQDKYQQDKEALQQEHQQQLAQLAEEHQQEVQKLQVSHREQDHGPAFLMHRGNGIAIKAIAIGCHTLLCNTYAESGHHRAILATG
jgi:hypothetical protein